MKNNPSDEKCEVCGNEIPDNWKGRFKEKVCGAGCLGRAHGKQFAATAITGALEASRRKRATPS